MFLICGLGNPGEQYEKTRHNVGFMAVDEFRKKNNLPDFELLKKEKTLISKGEFSKESVLLAKPQTFMNNSGKALKSLFGKYKIQDTKHILVIHDDLDLPLDAVRISQNRGAGGHKGVESVIKELKTKDFIRLRIGIEPKNGKIENPEKFVLQKFGEKDEIKKILDAAVNAIEAIIQNGPERAMAEYNK